MNRGYFSRKDLAAQGWEFLETMGRDIPMQQDLKDVARRHNLRAQKPSAFRLRNGIWAAFYQPKIHATKKTRHKA